MTEATAPRPKTKSAVTHTEYLDNCIQRRINSIARTIEHRLKGKLELLRKENWALKLQIERLLGNQPRPENPAESEQTAVAGGTPIQPINPANSLNNEITINQTDNREKMENPTDVGKPANAANSPKNIIPSKEESPTETILLEVIPLPPKTEKNPETETDTENSSNGEQTAEEEESERDQTKDDEERSEEGLSEEEEPKRTEVSKEIIFQIIEHVVNEIDVNKKLIDTHNLRGIMSRYTGPISPRVFNSLAERLKETFKKHFILPHNPENTKHFTTKLWE
jgi:hypothetical protein